MKNGRLSEQLATAVLGQQSPPRRLAPNAAIAFQLNPPRQAYFCLLMEISRSRAVVKFVTHHIALLCPSIDANPQACLDKPTTFLWDQGAYKEDIPLGHFRVFQGVLHMPLAISLLGSFLQGDTRQACLPQHALNATSAISIIAHLSKLFNVTR